MRSAQLVFTTEDKRLSSMMQEAFVDYCGLLSLLDRQLRERVNITNFKGPILMNRRNEMGGVRVDRMRYMRWGGN